MIERRLTFEEWQHARRRMAEAGFHGSVNDWRRPSTQFNLLARSVSRLGDDLRRLGDVLGNAVVAMGIGIVEAGRREQG